MRQAAAVLIHFRPIVLTAAERHRLKKAAWGHKTEYRARLRAQIVLRAARRFHRVASCAGQGAGLPASGRGRRAAVALVVPGAGPRGRRAWHRALPLGVHRAPLARPGRAQALAAPLVDLHHRPGLPAQGRARAGPVCPRLGRHPARRGRVRDQRGREDLYPGPLSLPSHPGTRPGESDAGESHLRARRRAGLPGRLRRPPGHSVRPLRADHRHSPVHGPGRPGDAPGALREREARVLDRRQRLLPPRQGRNGPSCGREIFFSVVQRKVVAPNDFTDLAQVGDRLRAFEDRYNARARPFMSGSTGIPPITQKNPPSRWQHDQPSKDFWSRPLSAVRDHEAAPPSPGPRQRRLRRPPGQSGDQRPGELRDLPLVPLHRAGPAGVTAPRPARTHRFSRGRSGCRRSGCPRTGTPRPWCPGGSRGRPWPC